MVVVFDYSSASDLGQGKLWNDDISYSLHYQYDPGKKTLLGELLKSNKENVNTIKNLKE